MIEHLVQNSPPMPDYSGHPVGERHQDCPICSAEGMTAQTNTLSDELVERLRDYRSDWHKRMGDVSVLDDAISGIERVQEEARKREWRLIETAPKDATWVLTWSKRDGHGMGRYMGYTSLTDDENWSGATHWMPLPEAPALSADMGEDHR